MKLEELRNKKILILGYGIEGKATRDFLHHYFPEMTIGTADQKDGPNYLEKQKDYDLVIKSPGVPKKLITVPYTTATNIFFANVRGTTVGITGSKGKSTTTALVYEILKQTGMKVHLVGNIGNPLLKNLLKTNEEEDVWVCELSSFQLDDIEYSPHISVILNLYPEHMDYHGTVAYYYEAKKRILVSALSNDYFVYNPVFPKLHESANRADAKAVPFIDTLPFDEKVVQLKGKHNIDNLRAAVTVGQIFKIDNETIEKAVKNFRGLPHRLELVTTFKGITFYDDAIATIPEATIAAIKSLENVGTIFLGGQDRGYDFSALADTIIDSKIPNLVLFPYSGKKILVTLKKKTKKLPNILETESMEEAVKFAYEHTPRDSICLLSCASPSFSLWKNFEEKGNLFQKFVREYGK